MIKAIINSATLAFLILLALMFVERANAAEPNGIAFVQAPEQSDGICIGDTPEKAFACAVDQCVSRGARKQDCLKTNWCFPSGWSIRLFVQHSEGLHWHETSCGYERRIVAEYAAKAICNLENRKHLSECELTEIYDRRGKPQLNP